MNNPVLMGLVIGLVIGIIESVIFVEDTGLAKFASDLTFVTVILGAVVGLLRNKYTETKKFLPFAGLAGAVAGFLLSTRSGLVLDDTVLMAINGLFIGAIIHFAIKKRGTNTPQ